MSDSFMKLRCKAGDLAFIINDEDGCEENIGHIVKVVGELDTDNYGLAEWRIEPLNMDAWYVHTRRGIEIDKRPYKMRIGHPDIWLLPIEFDSELSSEITDKAEEISDEPSIILYEPSACEE